MIKLKFKHTKYPHNHLQIYLISFLLFVNSCFYIYSIAPICPANVFFYIGFIYTIVYIISHNKLCINISVTLSVITCLYMLITQFFISERYDVALGCSTNFLIYSIGIILLPRLSTRQVLNISKRLLQLGIILYSIDTIYRFSLIKFNIFAAISNFYIMKVNNLFFLDTNFLGINTTVLCFLSLYLYHKFKDKTYLFFCIIYSVLTFFTFARAAIIATIVSFFIFYIFLNIKNIKKKLKSILTLKMSTKIISSFFILFFLIISIIYILIYIKNFLAADESFHTKVNIINSLFEFIKQANIKDLIIGIGYGHAYLFCGRAAHNYLATYIIETGFLGLTMVTTFLFSIFVKTPKTIYILLPFIIFSYSLIGRTSMHVLYSALVLIWYFENILPKPKKGQIKEY